MNYLAHLLLAGNNTEHQLGGLIGDFTKGRIEALADVYPQEIVQGISLHRDIDQFTDGHEIFHRSRNRISRDRRRVAGIIVDVIYDHFLSLHWERFSPDPKHVFIQQFYKALSITEHELPPRLKKVAPNMIETDWLGSYEDLQTIAYVYDRIATRFKRPTNLAGAIEEVEREFEGLEMDFLEFFPDLQSFSSARLQS